MLQLKGLDQFKHPTMRTLPLALRGASKIGWYEGSGFFIIMSTSTFAISFHVHDVAIWKWSSIDIFIDRLPGILNYKWSQTGIYDVYDKGIAGILVGMMAAAGGAYWRSNDKPTAM